MKSFIAEYGFLGFLMGLGLFFLHQFFLSRKKQDDKLDQIRETQIAMQENVRSTLDTVQSLSSAVRDHEIRITKLEVKADQEHDG